MCVRWWCSRRDDQRKDFPHSPHSYCAGGAGATGPGFSLAPSAVEAGAMSTWEPTITPGEGRGVKAGRGLPATSTHTPDHRSPTPTGRPFQRQGAPPFGQGGCCPRWRLPAIEALGAQGETSGTLGGAGHSLIRGIPSKRLEGSLPRPPKDRRVLKGRRVSSALAPDPSVSSL